MYVFLITFACFLLRSRLSVSLNMQAAARSDSCCKNHGICIPRFSNHCKNNGICTPRDSDHCKNYGICILRDDLYSPKNDDMIE